MPTEENFDEVGDVVEDGVLPDDSLSGGAGIGLDGKGRMPTVEEILAMIDSASSIPDEEKAAIKEDIIRFNNEKAAGAGAAGLGIASASAASGSPIYLFLVLVTLIALVIGFFTYKIINAEKEKERAKELKRKAREARRSKRKVT